MYTVGNSPELCSFLSLISSDGLRPLGFDWGAARDLPVLPRLRYDKVVITPRRWKLDASFFAGDRAAVRARIDAYWIRWNLPKVGVLVASDHRLLLDFASDVSIDLICDQLKGQEGSHAFEFQETEAASAPRSRRRRAVSSDRRGDRRGPRRPRAEPRRR
jgi:hypothetical protein